MNNLVEIVNLTKKYGTNVAVNHLTVSLPKGKIIGLLGPNGSGKTTLIKILNGLLTPTEGTILIDGNNVGPATKSKVAYLPDRTYLTMNQTIREILDYFQDFYADFSRERAEEMLKSLGIDPTVKMRTLSKGTKEKVQLILVMSRNASLYILDEPECRCGSCSERLYPAHHHQQLQSRSYGTDLHPSDRGCGAGTG